jgi:GTPase involved in cell partitioning and DNA repair
MRRIKLPQIGIVIVVCALVGALAGIAGSAAAPSKSANKSGTATKRAVLRHLGFRGLRGGPGGPGGPAVHAEAIVPNKAGTGFITVTSDNGTVKSTNGNDVTIDESVGSLHYKDVTVTIPDGATVIRNHAKASVSDIKVGDDIHVIASSEKTFVIAEDAAFQKQERQQFQKMFRDHRGFRFRGGPGPPPGAPGKPGFNAAPPAAPQGGGTTY